MRKNKEREARLTPERMETARKAIVALGYGTSDDGVTLTFLFKGHMIKFFPYTGWATGKGITDGRGLKQLLNQIKPK